MPSSTKMSLGEFMGGDNPVDVLPTAPRQRGPDDDGSFRRHDNRRRDDDGFNQASRGDSDDNWRRGGGGFDRGGGGGFDRGAGSGGGGGYRGGGGGGGYQNDRGDRDGGGGYDRRPMSTGGGADADTGSWRRGGGAGSAASSFGRGGGDYQGRGGGDYQGRGGGDYQGRGGGDYQGRGGNDSVNRGSGTGGGERPRLQLKSRTAPVTEEMTDSAATPNQRVDTTAKDGESNKDDNAAAVDSGTEKTDQATDGDETNKDKAEAGDSKDTKSNDKGRKIREPEVVNARAAAFGAADGAKRESNNKRGDGDRDRFDRNLGPPPVVNKRFEQLAVEERDRQQARDSRPRGPPPVANSRFAAAAEMDPSYRDREERLRDDRGPPPVANSRFAAAAAAAEADRPSSYNRDDRGPPPVANSRFAAAAEADRTYNHQGSDDRGPPPVANSRFAAAAEADRMYRRDDGPGRDDRGPPPVANSRFAAAAAMAEEEGGRFRQERNERFGGRNDDLRGPPPIQQNSRFANAVASDPDYVDRELRERQDDRGDNRFRGRDEYDDRRGGFGDNDGYGRGRGVYPEDLPRGPGRYNDRHDDRGPPVREKPKSSVADLLKPKARPVEENILKIPTKQQADNVLKVDDVVKPPVKDDSEKQEPAAEATKADPAPELAPPAVPDVDMSGILDEFASGKRQGEDLAAWIKEQPALPSVKSLVFHLLTETEKLNPDVECGWAESSKYGSALLSLVQDDLLKQMEVLFGIQKYCDKLGMPKLDDEYVVQAMFRAMYKYDLAEDEAFAMWKDDESSENEAGKLKAVIQTVDWFNWLEEDDDGEEAEEAEEENLDQE